MRIVVLLLALASTACSIPRWPVSAPVTSPYGLRFLGWRPDFHYGVDLGVPAGTPVAAMKSGTVVFAGTMSGYGTVIILQHSPNLRTVYAHLSELNVRKGDEVEGRQVIGKSGQSGSASGPHLHFEIVRFGRQEDPFDWLGEIH